MIDAGAMTLEEKVAQLLITFRYGKEDRSDYMLEHGWGGMLLTTWDCPSTLKETREILNDMQRRSKIPLFFGFDPETGVGQRVRYDVTRFPTLMGIAAAGDADYAYKVGRVIGIEAAAVGMNFAYTPVVDVNTNPMNPSINTRSYGDDPERVARMAVAQIRGQSETGLLGTAKHFPGAGMQGVDAHYDLERVEISREEMNAVHLLPYRKAIEAGLPCIMVSHAIFTAYDDKHPASLSKAVITDLLRGELGHDGLVITDGLVMGAISKQYSIGEAATLALLAGNDVLVTHDDLEKTLPGLLKSIREGRITEELIDQKVRKVLRYKKQWGIFDWETRGRGEVDFEAHRALAREISERSVTLAKNEGDVLPIPLRSDRPVLVVEPLAQEKIKFGVHIWESTLAGPLSELGVNVQKFDLSFEVPPSECDAVVDKARRAHSVVLMADFRSSAGTCQRPSREQAEVCHAVHAANSRTVGVTANPYVLEDLLFLPVLMTEYGGSEESDRVTAEILVGRREALGKLPVKLRL